MTQHVDGSMFALGDGAAIRMQARYPTDIEDMWSALTEPDRLARWLGEFGGDLRQGGTITAAFVSTATGTGRIEVCDRPHRLLVTMDGEGKPSKQIEATLAEDGDETVVTIEERVFTLDEAPLHGAGWQVHVEDLLTHLGGETPGDWKTRWEELIDSYRAQQIQRV